MTLVTPSGIWLAQTDSRIALSPRATASKSVSAFTPVVCSMPQFTGYFAIVGGALLVLGLLTKVASPGAVASIAGGVPARRGSLSLVPLRAGANEVRPYFFVFLNLATVAGGIWSLDFMIQKWRARAPAPRS